MSTYRRQAIPFTFAGVPRIAGLVLIGGGSAPSARIRYTGASGGDWAIASSWSGGSYPTSGDHALLDTTANLRSTVPKTHLVTGGWDPIWWSTGPSNTVGSVTVGDAELMPDFWQRCLRMKLMY